MCRILFALMIVLSLFVLVDVIWGTDALLWALFIAFAVSALGLLFFPRRGPQNAYQNWFRLQALFLLLFIVAYLIGCFFLIVHLNLPDYGIDIALILTILSLAIITYLYVLIMMPPTRRRSWTRKHYPAVWDSIKRYHRKGNVIETYTPVLIINDRKYFLIYYHDSKTGQLNAMILLDEGGNLINDRGLIHKAMKCKTLALNTVDYANSNRRAGEIEQYKIAISDLENVFRILREEKDRFSEYGPQAKQDLEKLLEAEDAAIATIQASIDIKMLEAEWSKKHKLGRLTEVRYENVAELESDMVNARCPSVQGFEKYIEAESPARNIVKLIKVMDTFPQQDKVVEGLLGIADSAEYLVGEDEVYEYSRPQEGDWEIVSKGFTLVEEVDSQLAEAGA